MIQLQANGEVQDAKGSFSYYLGTPKREAIMGSDAFHGFKETPQVAYIEGEITDRGTLDVKAAATLTDGTINLNLASGKTVVLHDAYAAGEWKAQTDEGNITVRWEGSGAEEIQA
jgi:hypothetical protein